MANVFAVSRPVVIGRLTDSLDIDKLCDGLPLSNEYSAKLLNLCLIELGVTGLAALNGLTPDEAKKVGGELARKVTLELELIGREDKRV